VKARSPAWIIIAGAVLVQSSGIMTTTGNALVGIDGAIRAIIDLKTIIAKMIPPPKFVPIKQVVVPQTKKQIPKKVAQK
jgi:hypothetical protein